MSALLKCVLFNFIAMCPSNERPRLYAFGAANKREKKHRLDNVVAGTSTIQSFFETTTASEVETSEGNPGNINGDAVDVAPPVPGSSGGTSSGETITTWTDSSGVRPNARQPDGSHFLSAGHIVKRTIFHHGPCRPIGPFAVSRENGNRRIFSEKNTTMHMLGLLK